MISRRLFTATALSSGVVALSGCGSGLALPGQPADLGRGAIDAHMHLFNGRDVPAHAFLQQVILPDLNMPKAIIGPLAHLIVSFLLLGTRTAEQELATLGRQAPQPVSRSADEARLASAIDDYYAEAQQQARATSLASARSSDTAATSAILLETPDAALLSALSASAGVPVAEAAGGLRGDQPAIMARGAAAAMPTTGQQLAPGLLDPNRPAISASEVDIGTTLQWATLMTHDRAAIRDQAVRLYGRAGEARIFCNYLVDLDLWLEGSEGEAISTLAAQVDLAARLTRGENRVLILNLAAFCPLRAAIDGPSVLEAVQRAITRQGFAGVKLYPPMGFRPDDNSSISFAHARGDIAGNPPPRAALDRALDSLYRWCSENDVPIAAHASHSMGAGPGTAAYSAPWHWAPVLERYPDLRVNLAHFGGFGRHNLPGWEDRLGEMMTRDQFLFFDTGYWDEAARDTAHLPGGPFAATQAFLARYPLASERMMYGSDWHMIAREPDHPDYHGKLRDFVEALTPDEAARRRIMGGNALRWLGLDRREGAQFQRLQAAHSGHPVWRELFGVAS